MDKWERRFVRIGLILAAHSGSHVHHEARLPDSCQINLNSFKSCRSYDRPHNGLPPRLEPWLKVK
jgi:hypothetical protein